VSISIVLVQDVSCFETIIECGAVQALLELLTSSERLMESASAALAQLSTHEACVQLIHHSDAIPVLVSLLSASNATIQEHTMRVLVHVANYSEECADIICDAGGLAPLVSLLSLKEDRAVVAQTLAHFSKASLASAIACMPQQMSQHNAEVESTKPPCKGGSSPRPAQQTGQAASAENTMPHIDLEVIHNYEPADARMLRLRAGEIIRVVGKHDGWLYAISSTGNEGYVPPSYLATPDGSPDGDSAERKFFDANPGEQDFDTTNEALWLDSIGEPTASMHPHSRAEATAVSPSIVQPGHGEAYSTWVHNREQIIDNQPNDTEPKKNDIRTEPSL